MTPKTSSAELIGEFLSTAHLAQRQADKALAVWPLVWPEGAPLQGPDYVGLGEALEHARIVIDEVDASGEVPHVRVTNLHKKPVLFLFGEEIVGAKQNRVANASFLVPAGEALVLDVSCVEAGRWDGGGKGGFRGLGDVVSPSMRQRMGRQVSDSLAVGSGFRADQADVWDQVETRLRGSGTASRSSAYADYRASRATELQEVERAFHPVERQVGFVAAIGDEIVGVEVIGRPEVFAASYPTLVRSYAIDAVDQGLVKETERSAAARFIEPAEFLAALANAPVRESESLGMGTDLRAATRQVEACALASGGLVHLTAFPTPEAPKAKRRMAPWRRRSSS